LLSLQQIIGGHPYLLNLAFCNLAIADLSLDQLIAEAATETGIYSDRLRGYLKTLHNNPELALAYQQVVTSFEPIELNSMTAYKLESLGLIKLQGNKAIPACELYRTYFGHRLK
jgi:hypothetical protein